MGRRAGDDASAWETARRRHPRARIARSGAGDRCSGNRVSKVGLISSSRPVHAKGARRSFGRPKGRTCSGGTGGLVWFGPCFARETGRKARSSPREKTCAAGLMRRSGDRAMHESRCAGPLRSDDDPKLGQPGGGSKAQRKGPCEGARFDVWATRRTKCASRFGRPNAKAHTPRETSAWGEVADRLGLGQPGREVCTRQTRRPGNRETRA